LERQAIECCAQGLTAAKVERRQSCATPRRKTGGATEMQPFCAACRDRLCGWLAAGRLFAPCAQLANRHFAKWCCCPGTGSRAARRRCGIVGAEWGGTTWRHRLQRLWQLSRAAERRAARADSAIRTAAVSAMLSSPAAAEQRGGAEAQRCGPGGVASCGTCWERGLRRLRQAVGRGGAVRCWLELPHCRRAAQLPVAELRRPRAAALRTAA